MAVKRQNINLSNMHVTSRTKASRERATGLRDGSKRVRNNLSL
jgi:hypothetical protein